jgi:hypothetical protein
MNKSYELKNNVWEVVQYSCQYCKQRFAKEGNCINHETKCKNINTLKKKEKP